MPAETPKLEQTGENAPERRVFENVVFTREVLKNGKTRYRSSAPGRKLIVLSEAETTLPVAGKSYNVEVMVDTDLSTPLKGMYVVRILSDDPEFSDVPMVSEQAYQERQLPLPLEVDEGAGSVYVLETQLPLNPIGGEEAASEHVPNLKKFEYFTLEKRTLEVIEKIALAVSLGEPCLLEGETSTSKTSCIEYLAALTRTPVLRMNLNGQTDTSELIGKFVPHDGRLQINFENALRHPEILTETSKSILERANKEGRPLTLIESQKIGAEQGIKAPDWRWQDGLVPEAMKKGFWLILDEINLAEPQVLERINPVLERHPSLTISENGGLKIGGKSAVPVHPGFRIFATMNPAEYSGRQPMSPAYKDRWTAYKYVEIPSMEDYEAMLNFMVYGVQPAVASHDKQYRGEQKKGLHERLAAIPNFNKFLPLLASFHKKLEVMMQTSQIGKGRKEKYIITRRTLIEFLGYLEQIRLTDRATKKQVGIEEMPKEIILRALEFYYTDKVRAIKEGGDPHDDFKKLQDLLDAVGISRTQWKVPEFIKPPKPQPAPAPRSAGAPRKALSGSQSSEPVKPRTFQGFRGIEIKSTVDRSLGGYTIGDRLKYKPEVALATEIKNAKVLEIVGFTDTKKVIVQFDGDECFTDTIGGLDSNAEIIGSLASGSFLERTFKSYLSGADVIKATAERTRGGFTVGDQLRLKSGGALVPELQGAQKIEVVGFTANGEVIMQFDDDKCAINSTGTVRGVFEIIPPTEASTPTATTSENFLKGPQVFASEGGFKIKTTGEESNFGYTIGDRLIMRSGAALRKEAMEAKSIVVVGFTAESQVVIQLDGGICFTIANGSMDKSFKKIPATLGSSPEPLKLRTFKGYTLGGTIEATLVRSFGGYTVGDKLRVKPEAMVSSGIKNAKVLEVVGFTSDNDVIVQIDGDKCFADSVENVDSLEEIISRAPAIAEPIKPFYTLLNGKQVTPSHLIEVQGSKNFKVGDQLKLRLDVTHSPELFKGKNFEIVGIDDNGRLIVQIDGGKCWSGSIDSLEGAFEKSTSAAELLKPRIFTAYTGKNLEATLVRSFGGYTVGDQLRLKSGKTVVSQLQGAKKIEVVGFTADGLVILQYDGDKCGADDPDARKEYFDIISTPQSPQGKKFKMFLGGEIEANSLVESNGYRVGDELKYRLGSLQLSGTNKPLFENAKKLTLVGFIGGGNSAIIQADGNICASVSVFDLSTIFENVKSIPSRAEQSPSGRDPETFLNDVVLRLGGALPSDWRWQMSDSGTFVDMRATISNMSDSDIDRKMTSLSTDQSFGTTEKGIPNLLKALKGKKVRSLDVSGMWYLQVLP